MKDTSFVAFGNDELGKRVKKGQLVQCESCKGMHELQAGIDGRTNKESSIVLYFNCGGSGYLGAVDGRLVPGVDLAGR
jgi:hypothetical protein